MCLSSPAAHRTCPKTNASHSPLIITLQPLRTITVALLLAGLSSCPNPLTPTMTRNVKDTIDPVIEIYSPGEGSTCANIVEVVGRVTDDATVGGDDGQVRSVTYLVAGSTIAGTVPFDSDGAFRFQFPTVTLGSNFTLVVTAVDWNGNAVDVSLSLRRQAGNGIPSFSATPGNGEITLTWDAVPHTMSYTLSYTTNGFLPSDQVGVKMEQVSSPCVITGLTNGNLHVFRLDTVAEVGWPDSVSDYVSTIPLSELTLAPRVTGEYGQIRVSWATIAGTNEFEVWRSTEQDGTYHHLTRIAGKNQFIDTAVVEDQWYWYRIRPTMAGTIMSAQNVGRAITVPYHPIVMGNAELSSFTFGVDVALQGSYAYVIDDNEGLKVIDVSDPRAPRTVKTIAELFGYSISSGPSFLCVSSGTGGLRVLSISNPKSPAQIATCPIANAWGVAVSGSYAYVCDSDSGLKVVSLANPASPAIVGSCPATGASEVTVNGQYAYVADPVGLRIINIANPASPSLVGTCPITNAGPIAVQGSLAFVTEMWHDDLSYVRVVNISNPSSPSIVGSHQLTSAQGVAAKGSFVYVTDWRYGIKVISVVDPADPILIDTIPSFCVGSPIIDGSRAYAIDHAEGLLVIDVTHPASFTPAGTCDLGKGLLDIEINGPLLYTLPDSLDFRGMAIYEISDPLAPQLLGTYQIEYQPTNVVVSGHYAFIAEEVTGLRILDISDPTSPRMVSTCTTPWARDVAVFGQYAYVADFFTGLVVIDVSHPEHPTRVVSVSMGGSTSITINESYAYLGVGTVYCIDITNPLMPVITSHVNLGGSAQAKAIQGQHAFIASYGEGLVVLDVSNPYDLTVASVVSLSPTNEVRGLSLWGSCALVWDDLYGLEMFDLRDPENPLHLGTWGSLGGFITVNDPHAYIWDWNEDLVQILELSP